MHVISVPEGYKAKVEYGQQQHSVTQRSPLCQPPETLPGLWRPSVSFYFRHISMNRETQCSIPYF